MTTNAKSQITREQRKPVQMASVPTKNRRRPIAMFTRTSDRLGFAAVVIVVVLVGITNPGSWVHFADTLIVSVLLTLGLNIPLGMAGQLDFGHTAFFAAGAYSAALVLLALPTLNFIVVLIVGAIAGAAYAAVLGFPVFRVKGHFVALMTVAVAVATFGLAQNLGVLGGASGLAGIPVPNIFGTALASDTSMLWLGLALFVVVYLYSVKFADSRAGRALAAIREDELAAKCSGIGTLRYKIYAYTVGGAIAGLAGAYSAGLIGFVGPNSFDVTEAFVLSEAVILGGLGSVFGAVAGAIVVLGFEQISILYVPQLAGNEDLVIAAIILVLILTRPQGLLGRSFLRKRA